MIKPSYTGFWQSVQKTGPEGKGEKKTRMAITKHFVLHAKANKSKSKKKNKKNN